ncbi:hypothetical protein, partial [Streptomyces sp. NPDC057695]|uniref:hypothetical protein n=1 Tax=Streptomyces sp. NPDC057695 TaxID=3346217 RepID=UPI0036802EC9
ANLSARLREVGRWEEARAAFEEAVRYDRALAEANRDVYLPDLARSLAYLSAHLHRWGGGRTSWP